LEQWNEILNAARSDNNSNGDGILEKIKAKLKEQHQDIYREWEQKHFNIHHLFCIRITWYNSQVLALLYIAAASGHENIVKYLMEEQKADVNRANHKSETALHWAAGNGHVSVVQYLIEKNIDVNKVDESNRTALHWAAENDHVNVVQYLIEKNIDVNKANYNGETALHVAVGKGHEVLSKLLIKHEIKLKGSEAQKPDYLVERRKMSEYWNKCLDEVERMKEEKVDKGITFYDILTSREANKLISYEQSNEMVRVSEGGSCENKFPIYTCLLNKIGKQRADALRVGETIIKDVKHVKCTDDGNVQEINIAPAAMNVAEYLSNEDIENLEKAAKTKDKEEISQSLGSDVHVELAAKKQGRQA